MYGYIYMIVNKINGKTYIGQRKFNGEWYEDKYMGSGKLIRRAFEKYGKESFEKFFVQYVLTKEEADKQEIFWISEYRKRGKAEYNITNGGEGVSGLRFSEESKEKMRKSQKDYYSKLSKEERKKKCATRTGQIPWNKGKKENLSEEAREKILKAHKGKHHSEETKKKLSDANKGKHSHCKGMTWKIINGKRVWVEKEVF